VRDRIVRERIRENVEQNNKILFIKWNCKGTYALERWKVVVNVLETFLFLYEKNQVVIIKN